MTEVAPNLSHLIALAQDAAGTAKAATQVATENIAGTRDPNYVKRESTTDIDIINGRISGIRAGLPQRVVDEKIVAAKRDQHTELFFNKVKQEFLELLDDMNGKLDSEGSIHHKLLNFSQMAASLTADANSTILRRNVVESLKEFTGTINAFAAGISDQRNIAERGVSEVIQEVNVLTGRLFKLNEEISRGAHREQDVTALETKRETVVEEIAKLVDIQVVKSQENVFLYTKTGKPLVEYKHYPMNYKSSGVVDYSSSYPLNINPVTLKNDRGDYVDVNEEFSSGKLGAYIKLRDEVYPAYQKAIDNFSKMLETNINHIHNKGTGFPPPTHLDGSRFIESADKDTQIDWQPDATVRIAIVDATGQFSDAGAGVFHVDLNLNPGGAGALTPIEIRDQINAALGVDIATFSETPTANSADDYGYFKLSAPPGLRIAIGEAAGQVIPETTSGVGFSEYFHLNDLLVSFPDDVSDSGYANSLAVRTEIAKDQSLMAIAMLNDRADVALVGSAEQVMGVTAGDGRNLKDLRDKLNDPAVNFVAAGPMPADTTSFLTYVKNIVNTINLDTSSAMSNSKFSDEVLEGLERRHALISGVTQDEEIGEVMAQKIFYKGVMSKGVMSTSQHLMDMVNALLALFDRA